MPFKGFAKLMGEARLAYLHLGLPLGVFPQFVQEIHQVLREVLDLGSGVDPGSPRVEYLFVAGEGDLCVRLELPHYRQMARVQTALNFGSEKSEVLGRERSASWKFSIPIDVERAPLPALAGPTVRFISHLRIRRELYVAGGTKAEAAILDGILGTADECSDVLRADVEIGLGWADFLVTGETNTTGERFYRFLKGLRELRTEDGFPVFQKTVTVLGLACDPSGRIRQPRFTVDRALCLVRSQAGHFDQAHGALAELAATEPGEVSPICVLDGRNDLCLLPGERKGASGAFIERLHDLATRAEKPLSEAIERMQTHLLVVDPAPSGLEPTTTMVAFSGDLLGRLEDRRHRDDGALSGNLAQISRKVRILSQNGILDKRLVLGVSSTLSGLRRAVADDLNHYDTRLAILSVLQGGRSLLTKIDDFHAAHEAVGKGSFEDLAQVDALRSLWASALAQARNDLLEWCHLSERVLGERLTGSYDDFFGESGGSTSPRGGLQKVNFLADAIMQAFVHLLPASYSRRASHPRYFAAVFESISRIGSIPGVGLISLPIKFRFALPRATPHILHEVAMLLFYQRFPSPTWLPTSTLSEEEKTRAQFLEERAREVERVQEAAAREHAVDSERFGDSGAFTLDDLPPVDQAKLFENIAESASDTLVCAYGFGGLPRFRDFARDLTLLFIERVRESGATYGSGPNELYNLLLFRLLVVWETLAWLEPQPPSKSKGTRERVLFKLASLVDEVLLSPRFHQGAGPPPFVILSKLDTPEAQSKAVKLALRKISSATYQVYFEPFLEDLQASIEQDRGRHKAREIYDSKDFRDKTAQMARGEVVDLPDTAEIVPCYLELLRREHADWLNGDAAPRGVDAHARHRAALARSAILASFVLSRESVAERSA
jgi:hypothetical protein